MCVHACSVRVRERENSILQGAFLILVAIKWRLTSACKYILIIYIITAMQCAVFLIWKWWHCLCCSWCCSCRRWCRPTAKQRKSRGWASISQISTRTNSCKITWTNTHALSRTCQLDRSSWHWEDFYCYSECPWR